MYMLCVVMSTCMLGVVMITCILGVVMSTRMLGVVMSTCMRAYLRGECGAPAHDQRTLTHLRGQPTGALASAEASWCVRTAAARHALGQCSRHRHHRVTIVSSASTSGVANQVGVASASNVLHPRRTHQCDCGTSRKAQSRATIKQITISGLIANPRHRRLRHRHRSGPRHRPLAIGGAPPP